ncbi:MAG: DinB family protein [Cyclobacteriaceae bacterium]
MDRTYNMDWRSQLNPITEQFQEEFSSLNESELNWKPSAKIWSIAEILTHIIQVNESYYPSFQQIIDGTYKAPFTGKFGFLVNMFGNAILKSMHPTQKRKTKTMLIWEPSKSDEERDIVDQFVQHQSAMKDWIVKLDPYIASTLISSPANSNIVYKLSTCLEIIVAHEKRHFIQACEVKLKLPKIT